MASISNNTDNMRTWSNTMDSNANEYDTLIKQLYSVIGEFVDSKDFKGALSSDFNTRVLNQKQAFLNYSATFRECAELINQRAAKIDNNKSYLKNLIDSSNPLG